MDMKNSIPFIIFLGSILTAHGQETEVRKVSSFSAIKSAQAIDVYLKKGEKEELRVESLGIDLDEVLTEVSGGSLRIHLAKNSYRKVNVKVYVTYKALEKISASSASSIFSEGAIKSSSLDISASSASSIEISIDTERVEVSASSAANIDLQGKTTSLDVEVSSAGEIDAYNLQSDQVTARASSAGSVKVSVAKELDAHASSAGSIRYRGSPSRTNTGSSSGGSVKKSN
jgi:hypothetical protein